MRLPLPARLGLPVLLALGVALAPALTACGRSSTPASRDARIAKLFAHTDRMIKILEDDQAEPDKAARELAAYQEANRGEIEELKRELGEYMQKEPMKAAAAAGAYGLKTARLAGLTEKLKAR